MWQIGPMMLVDHIRTLLGDPAAASFQMAGEDAVLLTGAALNAAAQVYSCELGKIREDLRKPFEDEQLAWCRESHDWLRRYNRSVYARILGYLELGKRLGFEYPWPVVAILGICQVEAGLDRLRLFGLAGRVATRVGLPVLERATDLSDDVLRRTNRGIFADSVPTVLYAIRAHDARRSGNEALARALLDGPLPPLMDDESRRIAKSIYDGLAIANAADRFRFLADLTLRHFDREQAVFTHQLGGRRGSAPERPSRSRLGRWLSEPRSVPAPLVERDRKGPRLVFKPFRLPPGFDMRDHAARVRAFGEAFVTSVTQTRGEYEVARDWVVRRFET